MLNRYMYVLVLNKLNDLTHACSRTILNTVIRYHHSLLQLYTLVNDNIMLFSSEL